MENIENLNTENGIAANNSMLRRFQNQAEGELDYKLNLSAA